MLMPDRIPVRLQVQARPDEDDRRIVPAVLASGRLGARFGRRRFFLAGHIVFVTGSLMAAAAAAAGLQLSAIGLGALVFAIIEGTDLGWWRPLQDFSVLGLTWPATRPISIVFVLPLFRINALGLGVLHAGFVLAGMALGAFFSGASARHLAARFGPPKVVLIGLGLGLASAQVTSTTLRDVPTEMSGQGSAPRAPRVTWGSWGPASSKR